MTEVSEAAETALIVRVRLPEPLEALRRAAVPNAARGLPAHVTLLYPFTAPAALDDRLRMTVARVVDLHHAFSYRIDGPARWPEVLFASVDPEEPFRSLYADLSAAFPEFHIYGGGLEFVPHVTVAETQAAGFAELAASPAWSSLPATRTASSIELIVLDNERWTAKWRYPLQAAVLVLVCGERLRSDDGAAARAIEGLDAETRALVEIVEVGQLSVEALLEVPEGVAVIVVDAAIGIAPGAVVALPLDDVGRGRGVLPASSHTLPPDQIIGLAGEVRGESPPGCFVGIGGAEFGLGEHLSPQVEAGITTFTAAIATEIRRLAPG